MRTLKEATTEAEKFVWHTVKTMERGELVGLSRNRFDLFARQAGFSIVQAEMKPQRKPWKPINDFYFRCEK